MAFERRAVWLAAACAAAVGCTGRAVGVGTSGDGQPGQKTAMLHALFQVVLGSDGGSVAQVWFWRGDAATLADVDVDQQVALGDGDAVTFNGQPLTRGCSIFTDDGACDSYDWDYEIMDFPDAPDEQYRFAGTVRGQTFAAAGHLSRVQLSVADNALLPSDGTRVTVTWSPAIDDASVSYGPLGCVLHPQPGVTESTGGDATVVRVGATSADLDLPVMLGSDQDYCQGDLDVVSDASVPIESDTVDGTLRLASEAVSAQVRARLSPEPARP
jgi:hypothetical protein